MLCHFDLYIWGANEERQTVEQTEFLENGWCRVWIFQIVHVYHVILWFEHDSDVLLRLRLDVPSVYDSRARQTLPGPGWWRVSPISTVNSSKRTMTMRKDHHFYQSMVWYLFRTLRTNCKYACLRGFFSLPPSRHRQPYRFPWLQKCKMLPLNLWITVPFLSRQWTGIDGVFMHGLHRYCRSISHAQTVLVTGEYWCISMWITSCH